MAEAIIQYKLDLIVRLVDTTTGKKVEQKQVIFKADNQILVFQKREEGVYVLLNHGRENMTLEIIAEGVETKEQSECLKELGCDYLQGYYYAKPMPKDDFIAFIKEHR